MQAKKLDIYLANLAVLNAKFHHLHWNVKGERFQPVHEKLEEFYDEFFEYYDAVAEYMKMQGEFPQTTYREYLEITTVQELESKSISIGEALDIAKQELEALKALCLEIRAEASDEEFLLSNMLEDHVESYTKSIWFLTAAGH